jgi:GntR family transcriptional regulator/MocR family aminotransferase
MRTIYQARRDLLVTLLRRDLDDLVDVDAPDSGMNLIAWLRGSASDVDVSRALLDADVDTLPLSTCTRQRRLNPGLLLGFSGIREPDLRDGVRRLAAVLRSLPSGQRRRRP